MALGSEGEGRLCRWALALQELDIEIKYRTGSSNANADALSRVPAAQLESSRICSAMLIDPELTNKKILEEQHKDAVRQQVIQHISSSQSRTLKAVSAKAILTVAKAVISG